MNFPAGGLNGGGGRTPAIQDGEVVFVGMRLPLLAFCLAKRTHAPGAFGMFESGIIRDTPSPRLLFTMCDPQNVVGAAACTATAVVMGLLQRGEVDVGFLVGPDGPLWQPQHHVHSPSGHADGAAAWQRWRCGHSVSKPGALS